MLCRGAEIAYDVSLDNYGMLTTDEQQFVCHFSCFYKKVAVFYGKDIRNTVK